MKGFPLQTALAIATFGGLLLLPEYVPALKAYQSLKVEHFPTVLDFPLRKTSADPIGAEMARVKPDLKTVEPGLKKTFLDPEGAMDPFYQALLAIEQGKAERPVRIAHYGDSPTTADLITADVRGLLQSKFGNAGHGFILVDKPWAWYGHRGVEIQASGWKIEPATTGSRGGLYGFGGVSFSGSAGATSTLVLKDRTHESVEIAYLAQPGGGALSVDAGSEVLGPVDTSSAETRPGFATFPLPPDTRRVTLRVTSGTVRVFGVSFGKSNPGVVYDSLGLNGAYVRVLAAMFHGEHWGEQLRHYDPDLIVINYGTNESVYPKFVDFGYEKDMREIVRRIRAALPDVPILVMSPMDRGERDANGQISTVPVMPRLVKLEQQVALATQSAFFNTFEAMGGSGTMGRWYAAEPRLVGADFIHPMPAGAKIVGGLLYQGLLDGYNQFKLKQMKLKLADAAKAEAAR